MILADTSIWVDHLRKGDSVLGTLLAEGSVLIHPFVIGELACGDIQRRAEILALLEALPRAEPASHAEVLEFLSRQRLHGKGLGWIDAHLLAAAVLTPCTLWTRDKSLAAAARTLKVAR